MFETKAKKLIQDELTPAQSNRYHTYAGQLAKDKDPKTWDNHVEDFLMTNAKDKHWMKSVLKRLKDIGWNQSKYEYSKIDEAITKFQEREVPHYCWSENFQYAKDVMLNEVKDWNLKQAEYHSEKDIELVIPKKDTHSGFSYILTGKKHKGDYLGSLLTLIKEELAKAEETGSFNKPIMIGSRTQASLKFDEYHHIMEEFKQKTRLVSMVDIVVIIAECRWARAFQHRIGVTPWYAGGKDDGAINHYLQQYVRHHNYWTSIDYSSYDQTIPSWLIRASFDIVRESFQEVDARQFEVVREDFIHKVFLDAEGTRAAHKGVPSGSMFTQIIDSVANRLMIISYFKAKQIPYWEYDMMIMGDDNIIFTDFPVDTEELEAFLKRNYGIICNAAKCTKGVCGKDHPEFLSREWRPSGTYRDPIVLVSKLVAPERFRDYDRSDLADTYRGKVILEILCLIKAYFVSFPLGMRELLTHDVYDEVFYRTKSVSTRSKMATGLVQYMYELKNQVGYRYMV